MLNLPELLSTPARRAIWTLCKEHLPDPQGSLVLPYGMWLRCRGCPAAVHEVPLCKQNAHVARAQSGKELSPCQQRPAQGSAFETSTLPSSLATFLWDRSRAALSSMPSAGRQERA